MGLDFLDITFRLEKAFSIKLPRGWHEGMPFTTTPKFDLRAGDLHDHVCHHLRRANRPVPHSSWTRVKLVLANALGAHPSIIRREKWLAADLGASF
jgi:hypothetical protein